MDSKNRRTFFQFSGCLLAQGVAGIRSSSAQTSKKMRLGVITSVGKANPADAAIAYVRDLGFPTCQIGADEFTPQLAADLKKALGKYQVEATALIAAGPGRMDWNFYQGPLNNGLVPPETRKVRVEHLKKGSEFAQQAGIPALFTHCGFIPENPNDPVYKDVVAAIREVAQVCKNNGQIFLFETGQETPITLLRTIMDVGLDNLAVNLDTANLILYGKANPVDALDTIGKYIRAVHAKDGLYPTDPKELGREVAIGEGKVDFPAFFAGLKRLGYTGAITIEREITGPKQVEDIKKAKAYLEKLIG